MQIAAPPTFSRTHRLAPLFGLIFRRSSCQHPLLAGALGKAMAPSHETCSLENASSILELRHEMQHNRRNLLLKNFVVPGVAFVIAFRQPSCLRT